MKPLYTTKQLRDAVRSLFLRQHRPRRRIACVAYVGADCLDFIPDPQGLEVYCWPQPGCTSADGLNRLLAAKAKVRFIDRLHVKVYWTEGVGCVIGSANLSANALQEGNLQEFAVFLGPEYSIDVDKIIDQRLSRMAEADEIIALRREAAEVSRRLRVTRRTIRTPVTFGEWYEHTARAPWKLCWVGEVQNESKAAKEHMRENYSANTPWDWSHARVGEYQRGDWLLVFDPWTVWTPYWMHVDETIPKLKGEDDIEEYPLDVLQIGRTPREVPFSVTKPFPRALYHAVKRYGREKIQEMAHSQTPKLLLRYLREEWNSRAD